MSNDELIRTYSLLSTHDYLLKTLYAEVFSKNPQARANVPKALADMAKFRPLAHLGSDEIEQEALVQLQARVVLNMQSFFKEVENVLQQFERAQGK
jgi:hypothetical protein